MIQRLIESLEIYLRDSSLLSYLAVYLGGVLVSFTPCVYPVIPIIVGYIGHQGHGSRLRAVILSAAYVLGMSFTYAVLGAIAALTGTIFGQIQSNPLTYIVVANICIFLGLSMLDLFTLPLPGFGRGAGAAVSRQGVWGAFVVGGASGFVLGPCTAPVLAVLLSFVAARQNVVFGVSLLFVFAIGIGTLFMAVGVFSGLLASLPHAGAWMLRVKRLFGWILVGVGEYLLISAGRLII